MLLSKIKPLVRRNRTKAFCPATAAVSQSSTVAYDNRESASPLGPLWPAANENGEAGALQRTSPVSLFFRENAAHWLELAGGAPAPPSAAAREVADFLNGRGAAFFQDIVSGTRLLRTQVEEALGELAAVGLAGSDGIAGLRALVTPSDRRPPPQGGRRRGRVSPYGVDAAGRWELLRPLTSGDGTDPDSGVGPRSDADSHAGAGSNPGRGVAPSPEAVEAYAHTLLRRYGVVFHRLAGREPGAPRWRDLIRVYRRLEARGEIRGGRFVAGMSGEQFALPEAVTMLRQVRREKPSGDLVGLSAADPLNLTGVLPPTDRVPAMVGNRVVYRDGVPVAARVAGQIRRLANDEPDDEAVSAESRAFAAALRRPRAAPPLRTLEKGLKL